MKFSEFLNESAVQKLDEARGVPGLEKGKTYSVGATDSKFVEDLVFLGFAVGEEEKIKYDTLKDLFKGEGVKNLKELESKRKEENIDYYASFGNDRGDVSYAAYLADGKWLLGSGSGKLKVTLNESVLDESKTYESMYELEDLIRKNKANLQKIVTALEDNYVEDGQEDDMDEDSFVYSVVQSLKKIGAREIANNIDSGKDLESLEHYLQGGDNIGSIADRLHYHQNIDHLAKAIIEFIVKGK